MVMENASVSVGLSSLISNALDLGQKPVSQLTYAKAQAFASGAGLGQVDRIYADQVTLAASATLDLDMAGVLVDALGATLTLARIKLLLVSAASANTNLVVIGGGSNPITTIFGGTTPTHSVGPGGMFLAMRPDATGFAVTAGTGDILRLTNSAGGTPVTADVIIYGSST